MSQPNHSLVAGRTTLVSVPIPSMPIAPRRADPRGVEALIPPRRGRVQGPATRHPGLHRFFQRATWLWADIFLLLAAGLAALMVTEPAGVFLTLSTVATIVLVAAGTGASTLWFLAVLRRLGLRLRFAPP